MKRIQGFPRSTQAFTLIELLVVIGIIAVLASGVGLALRGNNPEASLRSAQGLAIGALSSARGQAALTQSNARIIVQADNNDANFLRSIRIVVPDSASPGNWKQVGGEIILPENVYVVPPTGSLTGVTFETANGSWNVGRNSTLFNAATASVSGLTNATKSLVSKDISSLGTVEGGRIVVTPGHRTSGTAVTLDNASAVRGLVVSRYGVASLVDEATSFDQITN
jgi:prepilin-type N-terminal cleavage/methylation domain-containing protein